MALLHSTRQLFEADDKKLKKQVTNVDVVPQISTRLFSRDPSIFSGKLVMSVLTPLMALFSQIAAQVVQVNISNQVKSKKPM